ncbi:SGNH/GDSL hydrolase family protein [Stenotrophomonas sp. SRS1]|jgi:lysophospholipase L1-like esterase|uniref:SGNH/GDSL hydrolase family protein n=1 Tax=Stenotrophomonas sp. SRS1 TaxID=2870345 RepID=UPI0022386DE1|nr:GDSL-type esterase/lipase family protein [Stenotrophomonas sp. SRS1]MCW6028055.1 SGNH/GDSL hydrolase family protein [Stenotrophomonas sp. SRS1]
MGLPYLALGDSYTIGEGVEPAGRWPMQLAAALRDIGVAVDDPTIIATTGWTTDELEAGIDADAPQGPFECVSLLIGVNDQYRGRSVDEYRPRFTALLQRALAFAGDRAPRVLVLSIPDWGVTPYAVASGRDRVRIGQELDAYNAAAAAICAEHDVAFVDITDLSRQLGGESVMLAEDGLHPSATMYTLWHQRAFEVTRVLWAEPTR